MPTPDINNPPSGTWYGTDGIDTVIGASERDLRYAPLLLLITLFWNGIVGFFTLLPLGATLKILGVTLPQCFPAPIMNHKPMDIGTTIMVSLFLIPFLVIGIVFLLAFLSSLAGRIEIRVSPAESSFFDGIGKFGIRRRFRNAEVTDVRLHQIPSKTEDRPSEEIIIEKREGKPIKFGLSLSPERRQFLAHALRGALSICSPIARQTGSFDVVLIQVPVDKKINVIKVLREIKGLGLAEARALVEKTSQPVLESANKTSAEAARTALEEAGAKVEIKQVLAML